MTTFSLNFNSFLILGVFVFILSWVLVLNLYNKTEKQKVHHPKQDLKPKQSKLQDFGTYEFVEYDVPGKQHKKYLIIVKTHFLRYEDFDATLAHVTNVYIKHPVYLKGVAHNLLVQIGCSPCTFNKELLPYNVQAIGERPIYSTSLVQWNVRYFFQFCLQNFVAYMQHNHYRYYNASRVYLVLDIMDGEPPL